MKAWVWQVEHAYGVILLVRLAGVLRSQDPFSIDNVAIAMSVIAAALFALSTNYCLC